jgi:hypothetical protein
LGPSRQPRKRAIPRHPSFNTSITLNGLATRIERDTEVMPARHEIAPAHSELRCGGAESEFTGLGDGIGAAAAKIVRAEGELLSRRHAGRAVQVVAVINQSAAAHVKTAMKREPIEKHIAIAEIESGHCNGCRRE